MRVSSPFVLEIAKGNYYLICFQLPESTEKSTKKQNSYHKIKHKKTQFIAQKKTKKQQFIPQKKAQKKTKSFSFFSCASFCFFFVLVLCFFSAFFCFFSAFGKSLLLKHFQLASPAQLQPPLSQPARQASSPPAFPSPQAQPPGSAPRPCPGSVQQPRPLYVLYTHILLFCYRRCDGQHSKP